MVVARTEEPGGLMPYTGPGSAPAARELWSVTLPSLLDLADRPPDETPTEVTVTLRADARWSDGVPITVTDVAFTRDLVVNPSFPAWSRTGFDRIESVTAGGPGGRSAVLHFSTPFTDWRLLFDPVLPAHRLARGLWDGLPDVAGGPFRFEARDPGLSVTLARNPLWWGAPPPLDRVLFILVPDTTTQRQLYDRGEVDVIAPGADTNNLALLSALSATVTSGTGRRAVALVNTRRFPDASVRRAILSAVPAAEVTESVLKGEATAIVGPALVAAELTGTEVTFSFPEEYSTLALVARAAQRNLQAKGASVELRARESKRLWDEWMVPADFDIVLLEIDPDESPWCFVTGTDPCNVIGWSDPAALGDDEIGSATEAGAVFGLWDGVARVASRPPLLNVRPGEGVDALTDHIAEWGFAA